MRSKTFCFEKTIFRKDLTRFAPLWGLYLLCLVLGMILLHNQPTGVAVYYGFAVSMDDLLPFMALVNLIYALLTAGALFSDLFNSRMCSSIHALPVRRETWFFTHLVSGLSFSLVPTFLAALVALPLLAGTHVTDAWLMAPLWFLGANLQYLCCFGIALLCVQCAGNYLGLGLMYFLLQFSAYLCYDIIRSLYTPLLYGVITPTALASSLTPLMGMSSSPYYEFPMATSRMYDTAYQQGDAFTTTYTVCWDQFGRLGILALAGAAFALGALLLYRRRKVERTGDLLVYPVLEPVIQTAVSIACAYFAFYTAWSIDYTLTANGPFTSSIVQLLLLAGLAIGWFGARMVIRRSTRVFQPKSIGHLAILTLALALSLVLTRLDVLGISSWVPDSGSVSSVSLTYSGGMAYTDPQDIDAIIRLHQLALEDSQDVPSGIVPVDQSGQYHPELEFTETIQTRRRGDFTLTYQLNNGRTVRRSYNVWADTEAGDIYREYASRPEFAFYQHETPLGFLEGTVPVNQVQLESVDCITDRELILAANSEEALEQLRQAVLADFEDRTMAQSIFWHTGSFLYQPAGATESTMTEINILLRFPDADGDERYGWISVYPDSENTLAWLEQYHLLAVDVVNQ